ncbi:MAG: hypothetical protein E7361_00870 [Clostridiales bacterium]|nr:hypothetical protein [Clostridiales bacterium]
MNLLLENAGMPSWGLLIIFVVLIVVMIVPTYLRNKKLNSKRIEMMGQLKPGDTIITTAGVFGKILSVRETTIGRVFVIETGDANHKSYQEIHADAIMDIDNKRDIILDAQGNDITFAEEDKVVENKEEVKEEIVETKEEKPKTKKTTSAKKNVKKKSE